MDNSYIFNMLDNMQIQRTMIFTSLSSKDKAIALRLICRIENMGLNQWCMYDENGKERNISGDRYTEVISKMLKKCCIFLMLISKNSLASVEVKREIEEVVQTSYVEKHSKLKIIPILIGDANESDIPEDVVNLSGITTEVIVRRLNDDTDDEELEIICEEIRAQYIATILENIQKKFTRTVDAQAFLEIMDKCVKQKCSVASISETIKNSREVYTDSLREMHILSNEMLDFDCNAFCCTVIAANIRGNDMIQGKTKKYNPAKNGVKYFYYYPEDAQSEIQTTFSKIRSFVAKDAKSRREVTNLVRREFCFRNKLHPFFTEFNDMTQAEIAEHYHIVDEKDTAAFRELFSKEETQFYFAYADGDDIFQVPDEFFAWLDGDVEHFTFETVFEVSYDFVRFIGNLVELLEHANDINKVSYEALRKHYQYLLKLKKMDEWQAGKLRLSASESRRLVNYLLDYTADSSRRLTRKFPKIAKWLDVEYDENGNMVCLDEKIVDEACRNLIAIPIKKNDAIKLCYSFEMFIEETNLTAAWYSIEQYDSKKNDNMVFSYEIAHKSDLFEKLRQAFEYLIEIVPGVKEILLNNNSRFFSMH